MSGGLLERVASRTDEAEVYEVRSDTIEVELKNSAPRSALARESSGVAVRAIRGGRLGFAAATDRTERGETRLVENLFATLDSADEAGFTFPGALPQATGEAALGTFDPAVAALGPANLIGLAEEVLGQVRSLHPDVVFDVSVSRSVYQSRIENSRGAAHEERGTAVSIGVEFNRTRQDDVLLDDEYCGSPRLEAEGRRGLVERLLTKLDRAQKDAKLERPGIMKVLFSPAGSLVVLGPLLQGLSGLAVRTGTSPVRARRGEAVLDARLTIEDDPLRPALLGSARFDDEGLPRRKNVLYEGGVLRSFVHDLKTAAATKQEPTASGERAGVLGAPAPGFSNIVVGGGDRSRDELLRSIDRGILVESVIGMGQGNTLSGAFSNTVGLAYLVEKGEVVGRVKDVSIAGNVYEVLGPSGALVGLSREREVVYGARVLPWMLTELNVVGKGA